MLGAGEKSTQLEICNRGLMNSSKGHMILIFEFSGRDTKVSGYIEMARLCPP